LFLASEQSFLVRQLLQTTPAAQVHPKPRAPELSQPTQFPKGYLIMNKLLVAAILAAFAVAAPAQSPSSTTAPAAAKRPGEPIPGIDVHLLQADGTVLKTTQTSATGYFEFSEVKPGNYVLKLGKSLASVHSPRDVATGQASGQRQASDAPDDKADTANRRVNTSRSNIKNRTDAVKTDETTAPEAPPQLKAGVSTSRSNVRTKTKSSLPEDEEIIVIQLTSDAPSDGKRSFVLPHVLEKSGLSVEVKADGHLTGHVLKARHDTVKNTINNVR
jgi:hypothetical protein